MNSRLTVSFIFTHGYLGISGGPGGRYGAGGGVATIPSFIIVARGGGIDATGIPGKNGTIGE